MLVDLVTRLVQGLERRTGKFELPTGFEGNIGTAFASQRDDIVALINRLPAKPLETFEQITNTRRTVIGEGLMIRLPECEFFVLGPDPPIRFRLFAFGDPVDKLLLGFDDRAAT